MRPPLLTLTVVALLGLVTACSTRDESAGQPQPAAGTTEPTAESPPFPQGSETVVLDPADFVAQIDNPYWPMALGSTWVYRETDGQGTEQRVEVTVTEDVKTILGIAATVVHDVVTEEGQPVEDTWDWYAQDKSGNIWYLGEDTKEYKDGEVVSTEGSWEAGVDGAQAGVIMPSNPTVGMTFRQEYYANEAEDAVEILSLDEQATVPFGSFSGVLMTRDYTRLDPGGVEHKYYAKGIGPVLVVGQSPGSGREELLSFESGS